MVPRSYPCSTSSEPLSQSCPTEPRKEGVKEGLYWRTSPPALGGCSTTETRRQSTLAGAPIRATGCAAYTGLLTSSR